MIYYLLQCMLHYVRSDSFSFRSEDIFCLVLLFSYISQALVRSIYYSDCSLREFSVAVFPLSSTQNNYTFEKFRWFSEIKTFVLK